MSTKGLKKSSDGKIKRKKLKKSSIKQKTDSKTSISNTPRKLKSKPKSKLISKPKSDVLGKIPKKKKKKSSIKSSKDTKNHNKSKSKQTNIDESIKKKKKSSKSSKSTANGIATHDSSIPKRKKSTKPKRRKESLKINSLKKQLMSNGKSPSSAKKIRVKSPKKHIKKTTTQVQSMKKHTNIGYNRNMILPRPSITRMYGYGPIHNKKKKKTTDIKAVKVIKKKKSKEQNKKKKQKEIKSPPKRKLKKQILSPAKTEKLRKTVKTKTKRKHLYVIGDYVHIGGTKYGIIRYKGCLKHVKGIWYGVELLGIDTNGDCDGMFNGERYFKCGGISGIFVMYQGIDRKMKSDEVHKMLKSKRRKKRSEKNKQRIMPKECDDKRIKKRKGKKVKKDGLKIRSKTMNDDMCTSTNVIGTEGNIKREPIIALSSVSKVCIKRDRRRHRGRDIATQSDFNLRNLIGRGRKESKHTDGHRRTRSLSREDTSWMTHKAKDKNSSDRIKLHILAQKQLDLESLMRRSSLKKKKDIGRLFSKHIEHAKVNRGKGRVQHITNTIKLKDRLKNEEEAMRNAVDIVKELGFLKYIKDNDIYSKIYIKRHRIGMDDDDEKKPTQSQHDFDLFDMNNIDILSKFEGKTREILSKVICWAIVSIPGIEIIEMCNADINDDFMEIFVLYLSEYYLRNKEPRITVLSLQSNPISDRGMIALTKLIRINHGVLNTIKLQNNRRDISTLICQQICESLEHNEFIIKFEFEFRHYQWRDFRDKVVKRNAEKARIVRLELKKFISV